MKLRKGLVCAFIVIVVLGCSSCGKDNKKNSDKESSGVTAEIVTEQIEDATTETEPYGVTSEEITEQLEEDITSQEEAVLNTEYTVQNVIGTYVCERATVMISGAGDDMVNIDITWGSSAFSSAEWTLLGKYNAVDNTITYSDGVMKDVEYLEDGSISKEDVIYTDGSGTFVFDMNNGTMIWKDNKENTAEGMTFERANLNGTIGRE